MKPERIEELLRSQPPDEGSHRPERLLVTPTVRARPTTRARRPVAGAAAAIGSVALVGLMLVVLMLGPLAGPSVGPSPSAPSASPTAQLSPEPSPAKAPNLGAIPWLDATSEPSPTPAPTSDPRSLPPCTARDLVLVAGGWSGATGSEGGGATVINLSGTPCTVSGRPGVDLLDARGRVIAKGVDKPTTGPDLVVLQRGGVAGVITVWQNWCGDPPRRPLSVRMSLPGDAGDLEATVHGWLGAGPDSLPRCDAPGAGSSFGVPLDFSAPYPSDGGYQPAICTPDALLAFLGGWGGAAGTSYAPIIVLNASLFDCLLDPSPALELQDAAGERIDLTPFASPAASTPIVLPSGRAATGMLRFADWCVAPPAKPLDLALRFNSGTLKVEARSGVPVPACMSAPQTPPPTLFLDQPLTVPGNAIAPPPNPIDSLPLRVTISAPATAAPGSELDYTVTISNQSTDGTAYDLAALCPGYSERLFLPGAKAATITRHVLNCRPAGVLEAELSLTFAMRLPIPPDAPTGRAALVWMLGDLGPSAKAVFQIEP